jgi:hypothetical protein
MLLYITFVAFGGFLSVAELCRHQQGDWDLVCEERLWLTEFFAYTSSGLRILVEELKSVPGLFTIKQNSEMSNAGNLSGSNATDAAPFLPPPVLPAAVYFKGM